MSGRIPHGKGRPLLGGALVALGVAFFVLSGLCLTVHLRNDDYLMQATQSVFDGPGDDEAKAIALAHFVSVHGGQAVNDSSASTMARLEHKLPLELSPVTVLKEGFAFTDAHRFGPCGQLSRTVRAVAWLRHIPSHKVLLETNGQEHALVALYVNGAYRLFDPTYDFYWKDSTGHVATIDEVETNPEIFAQIFTKVPDYPYRLDGASYLRWSRLGVPGRWLRAGLVKVMGEKWVKGIDTPKLYERPWLGYALVNLLVGLFFLVLGALRLRATRSTSARAVAAPGISPALAAGKPGA